MSESTVMPPASDPALPPPATERWQPLRLGLVDLFYYDDEQFWFHDGRLLLRGNNGTGKSKVLALTLPFLLDGATSARRVEPDADPKKRMEWNLLMGGAHPNSERTGYSWVEFGRRDADGTTHFTTLGIGLKAAAGRGIVKTWYFVSSRRIGDLRLVDEHRTALSQERLRDELTASASGQLYTTQEAYRRAVDEELFQLGADRYAALIDLLIQLRQPQLSKKPDEKVLSAALTEALPPLDQAIVADVAESFRSLDEERAGIDEAKQTLSAAEDFLRHYRFYARVAARRHTSAMRLAHSAYEHAGRELREAEEQVVIARVESDDLEARQVEATQRKSELTGREQALRESPEMRDADRLNRAEREASDAENRSTTAAADADQAAEQARHDTEVAQTDAANRAQAEAEQESRSAAARTLAAEAGLASEHPSIVDGDRLYDRAQADHLLTRRREQATHVRTLIDSARQTTDDADHLRQALDASQAESASRAERLSEAHGSVQEAADAYRDRVAGHLRGLTALTIEPDTDEIIDAASAWAENQIGESPARHALERAAHAESERITTRRADAESTRTRLSEELAGVETEADELARGRDPEPPSNPTRDRSTTHAGAPLWQLTDYADTLDAAPRAAIEAALQSAGLLDAWIFPDGSVEADGDVVLSNTGSQVASSLASVLTAAADPDETVSNEIVRGVLERIGWGRESGAALWVDGDGSWGSGPARGRWSKPAAEYIGAGARAAHRREVITSLRARAEILRAEIRGLDALIAECAQRSELVRREQSGYPADAERGLLTAHSRAASAQDELQRSEQRAEAARERWADATAKAQQAVADLAEQAEQLAVDPTSDGVEHVLSAVADYATALAELRSAHRAAQTAVIVHDRSAARAAEAEAARQHRAQVHHELRTKAAGLRALFDQLQSTVGASVAELQAQLGRIGTALTDVADELKGLESARIAASGRLGAAEEKVQGLGERRDERSHQRDAQLGVLRVFVGTGVLRIATPDLDAPGADDPDAWTITAAVALSRTAEQLLQDAYESDESWARAQQRLSGAATEFGRQMSRLGHEAFTEQRGDVMVARVRYLQSDVDIDLLAERLQDDVVDRERLLTAREREILENHLVNEVAGHLHELLLSAEAQMERINTELSQRRTSTGMQLRVRWRERSDAPAGFTAARGLMIRSDATWNDADREAIGDFLQARIAEARVGDPSGGWQEHLEEALDYRRWHSFTVERQQNGRWQSASGPASGGERVLAVSVPLFAAAAAHYNSADPRAPRLILLDEAFAGVDDDSRAKSLGLLATFDLDVVMTSEREWGCYPQVPGLSIAQLSRMEGIDAVGVTRWQWDGIRLAEQTEVPATARAGQLADSDDDDTGLF
jgi:uncharacterized protein (TIGR02680 family)